MPTTELPETKQKAHEIARQIENGRRLKKEPNPAESDVTGGFNQESRPLADNLHTPAPGRL